MLALLLLLLTAWLRPCAAQGNELVMATTFSPSATVWIIDRWQKEPGSVMIRTLNRTSASLEQLLDTANAENVDLILTSSPMLLQHLQEHQNWRRSAVRRQSANIWCRNPFAPPPWPWRSPGSVC